MHGWQSECVRRQSTVSNKFHSLKKYTRNEFRHFLPHFCVATCATIVNCIVRLPSEKFVKLLHFRRCVDTESEINILFLPLLSRANNFLLPSPTEFAFRGHRSFLADRKRKCSASIEDAIQDKLVSSRVIILAFVEIGRHSSIDLSAMRRLDCCNQKDRLKQCDNFPLCNFILICRETTLTSEQTNRKLGEHIISEFIWIIFCRKITTFFGSAQIVTIDNDKTTNSERKGGVERQQKQWKLRCCSITVCGRRRKHCNYFLLCVSHFVSSAIELC